MRLRLPFLLLLVFLGLAVFPQTAHADAGTPLMWAGLLHLFIGNALVGVGEGLLLAWLFAVSKGKAIAVMIPANYFSAWIGGVFLAGSIVRALPMDLYNGWKWFWVMVVVTYCMTLILEWPFVAFCLRGRKAWFRTSVKANLVVQSASYILLFGWYWMASGTSLYTRMNIVSPDALSLPDSVSVYFINSADGDVYRRNLTGGEMQRIFDLHSTGLRDRLYMRPSTSDTNNCDLVARLETQDYNRPKFVVVQTDMKVDGPLDWHIPAKTPEWEEGMEDFGSVPRLKAASASPWDFENGDYYLGLRASNDATGEIVGFTYETPFGMWTARNAVQVSPHKVLFQLGDDQICAFDPVTRRVALLWHGRGPVPVIPLSTASSSGS